MIKNYFTIALRNIKRSKIYSVINIFGLSIGLACSMLIILYVKDEVSYDKFHTSVDQIYRIVTHVKDKQGHLVGKDSNTGHFQGPRFKAGTPGIESYVRVSDNYSDVQVGNEIQPQHFLQVDSTFFTVFSFPLLSGNPKTCLNNPRSVVLSEDIAMKQFGTVNALGKILMIKEDNVLVPYEVTGVAKRSPQNSSIKFEALLPFKTPADQLSNEENWFNFFLNTFVKLSPSANVQQAEKSMQRVFEKESKGIKIKLEEKYGEMKSESHYMLQSFTDMHMSKELPAQNGLTDGSNPMYSYILSAIAFFILLIACINFVNLTVARSTKRSKEIGIRKVVGGARKQLIFQFLGESFLLCLLAFLLAIGLVQLGLPVFNTLSNKALSLQYLVDFKLIAGYSLLFAITTLLAGFYPAIILSGYNPVETLYSRFKLNGKNYLQKSLVVLQFSLASLLIIGTFTLYRQFHFLSHTDLGYDDSNLVLVNKNQMSRSEAVLFSNELKKMPEIENVAFKNGGQWGTAAKVNGDSILQFAYETVDETYIPLLKIPILSGRNFSSSFPSDSTHAVIVNEAFVKKAGWQKPIGQTVDFWYNNNEKYTVIGVVKDYHFASLNEEIRPQLFTLKPGNLYGLALIKIKPKSEAKTIKYIASVYKKLFPLSAYAYEFKDESNRKNYEAEEKWSKIVLLSAVITIFISCIGLFGLSVLDTEKRTKEIGIRKVLGASVNNIATLLCTDFSKLVLIALSIAMPIAWLGADKWLQHYPYRINLGWGIFLLSASLVMLLALLTISFQAVKAAVTNPVKSLRSE